MQLINVPVYAGGDQIGSVGGRHLLEDQRVGSDKINIPKLCIAKSCGGNITDTCTKYCCATMEHQPCWRKHEDCLQLCGN
jgi:hypothetical protein